MNTYQAFFNGRRATINADSLANAKQQAVAEFKPRRKQEHMVCVVLVATPDKGAIHPLNSNAELG